MNEKETPEQYHARRARLKAEYETRQCTSKARYVSRGEARTFLRNCRGGGAANAEVYQCEVCRYFHVGTKRNTPKRRVEGLER